MKVYPKNESDIINFVKFKIVVQSIDDKIELEMALRHIHDSNIDTNFIAVNQIAHQYLDNQIIVNPALYDKLSS